MNVLPLPGLRQRGFSLLEMAVVLSIVGLLTISLWKIVPLLRDIGNTQPPLEQLALADEAVLGFVASRHRLPCPAAVDGNGEEKTLPGVSPVTEVPRCESAIGELPFRTLGLQLPARLRYGVYRAPGRRAVPTLGYLLPPGNASAEYDATRAEWLLPLRQDGGYVGHGDAGRYAYLPGKSALAVEPIATMSTVEEIFKTPHRQHGFKLYDEDAGAPVIPRPQWNGLDFCVELRNVAQTSADTGLQANDIRVAYAIAHPGALDANGDGSFFDGGNGTAKFEAPGAPAKDTYDDHVLAVGFAELAGRLACPAYLSRVNASWQTMRAAYDNFRLALAMLQYRAFELDVANFNMHSAYTSATFAVFNVVDSLLAFSNVAIEIATASGALKGVLAGVSTALAVVKTATTSVKLAAAIKKLKANAESLVKAKESRAKAERYADETYFLARTSLARAVALDEKGLRP
jgi:prepilin-type N-terminal cleavage/methylation domain-containing protein